MEDIARARRGKMEPDPDSPAFRWFNRRPGAPMEPTTTDTGFVAFYEEHLAAVVRYCRFRIANNQDAEDLAADIFLRAWRAFPPRHQANLRSWLFTIAHNTVASYYRSRKQHLAIDDDLAATLSDSAESPEAYAHRSDLSRELVTALQHLTPDQQRVIELRIAGLKGAEIAAVLGRSESAIKMLQYRALRELRTRFALDLSPESEGSQS